MWVVGDVLWQRLLGAGAQDLFALVGEQTTELEEQVPDHEETKADELVRPLLWEDTLDQAVDRFGQGHGEEVAGRTLEHSNMFGFIYHGR